MAKIGPKLAKNWLKSATIGQVRRFSFHGQGTAILHLRVPGITKLLSQFLANSRFRVEAAGFFLAIVFWQHPNTTGRTQRGSYSPKRSVSAFYVGGAPKERRGRRAVVQKGVLESPALLFPLYGQTLLGQRRKRLSENTLLDDCFPARRLLRPLARSDMCLLDIPSSLNETTARHLLRTLLRAFSKAISRTF